MGSLNFETDGTTQYYCGRQPLNFLGTSYSVGDELPFDAALGYSKRAVAQLEVFWNNGWIYPQPMWDSIPGNWDDIPGNFDDAGEHV